jgi:uroporphyrinogen III methyltransferase/synthase
VKNYPIRKSRGIVYLAGAGPGDPGLITLKAAECLKRADVVVYDYLANKLFLKLAPSRSEKIYVGKKGAFHAKEQTDINNLLIDRAKKGMTVVRLKGGDPFVFGRGGEEAEALVEAGIPFEVIPGVTSAVAVPAYAGIPVTHRDFTPAVTFVTGHAREEEEAFLPDWAALSRIGTVVFLMGYANLPRLAQNLIAAGSDPKTPVAVIEWGTLPRQRTVTGTLETIAGQVEKSGIRPPTITVIGKVVGLREKIRWFDQKPLFGKRILVTRSREQASELSQRLEELGAEAIEIPTIEIRPPSRWSSLDRAIRSLSKYQWLIFTSVNGVDSFFRRLAERKRDLRDLKGVRIAAIGPATARAVEEHGIRVDLVAREYQAEGLMRVLKRQKLKGKRILVPQARGAREILVEELKREKARVEPVEAYRSAAPREGKEELRRLIQEKKTDLVTFASSSTVENFVKMAGVVDIPVACIGPVTAKTAKGLRLNVVVQPRKSTIPALVDAIVSYYSGKQG